MIIIYHYQGYATSAHDLETRETTNFRIALWDKVMDVAESNPNRFVIWCDERCRHALNIAGFHAIFNNPNMVAAYAPAGAEFLPPGIGYVERSGFININHSVTYPTWRMSSLVGGTHASVILKLKNQIYADRTFDYWLNSVAKLAMPFGLRCYSEPKLLISSAPVVTMSANDRTLFKFVKQHYKRRWTVLLLICFVIFEKRFPVWSFIKSQFYRKRVLSDKDFFTELPTENQCTIGSIDVVIPTIGRKKYLYDFLNDLKKQTHQTAKIIIVEQNPEAGSKSELDFLTDEEWPFEIKHIFTNQPGVCNARNLALDEVQSRWVFFADDDIRIAEDFLERAFESIQTVGAEAFYFNCLMPGQKTEYDRIAQTHIFGAGSSIVSSNAVKNVRFKSAYEFGFGEDFDFGMQLLNNGCEIIYLPKPEILHLKAPIGGFRTKPALPWHKEEIQPKPSPQVMLSRLLYLTCEQLNASKVLHFLKNYKNRKKWNPVSSYRTMEHQWERSLYWALELKKKC